MILEVKPKDCDHEDTMDLGNNQLMILNSSERRFDLPSDQIFEFNGSVNFNKNEEKITKAKRAKVWSIHQRDLCIPTEATTVDRMEQRIKSRLKSIKISKIQDNPIFQTEQELAQLNEVLVYLKLEIKAKIQRAWRRKTNPMLEEATKPDKQENTYQNIVDKYLMNQSICTQTIHGNHYVATPYTTMNKVKYLQNECERTILTLENNGQLKRLEAYLFQLLYNMSNKRSLTHFLLLQRIEHAEKNIAETYCKRDRLVEQLIKLNTAISRYQDSRKNDDINLIPYELIKP